MYSLYTCALHGRNTRRTQHTYTYIQLAAKHERSASATNERLLAAFQTNFEYYNVRFKAHKSVHMFVRARVCVYVCECVQWRPAHETPLPPNHCRPNDTLSLV